MKIEKIFDSFAKETFFKNKFVLQTNYTPKKIYHRDKEMQCLASILAPIIRLERSSNLFVYGKTGTGKTLVVQYIVSQLMKRVNDEVGIGYINCKMKKVADTEYRIIAELIKKLGGKVPFTGLPTEVVYNKFLSLLEKKKKIFLIIFDEIDQAVKKIGDDFLYNLTRLNELNTTQIVLVGISNDVTFLDYLDPRVRSSLGEEEIVFPPYNAEQLKNILKERANQAFKKNVLEQGVIEKCAAHAAREHGDARRAIDLLRIAAELAEREGKKKVSINHVDMANEKIEKDKVIDIVKTEPYQFQLVLLSIINLLKEKEKIFTGDVYEEYKKICSSLAAECLTQRRIGDIIAELDMLGLINARVLSKGRYGRTREIVSSLSPDLMNKIKSLIFENIK